jgi:tetratricopeptide (TPR) repeat protein
MAKPLEAVGGGGEALEHMRAAAAHVRRGETDDAVRAYLAAGNAFLHAETDTANARRAFEAATALDPNNLDAVFQVGRTDVIEGLLTSALAKFQHVIERSHQTHVPALFEAGCIYQELGRVDRAILTFRKVLDRDRTNVQAIVNVGRHLQAMGMRPEALGYYVRAAETAFEGGQLGTCRQLLSLVLSINPLHSKGREMLMELNDAKYTASRPKLEAAPDPIVLEVVPPPAVHAAPVDAEGAQRGEQRDAIKREIDALAAAKATMEVELAGLRAKRDCAISELNEIVKATPARSAVAKPKPALLRAPKRPAVKRKTPKARGATESKTPEDRTRG